MDENLPINHQIYTLIHRIETGWDLGPEAIAAVLSPRQTSP